MRNIKKFNLFSTLLLLSWIGALTFSLLYNLNSITKKKNHLVLEHAKNAFQKDLMFRKWVSMHGGVYVFPSAKVPPNPYLSHIKDRDLFTTDGRTLTLMNPAYALRELMENFSGMYGEKGHITSLKLLNPRNKADEWETSVLKRFENKEFKEYHEIYNYNNKPHLRYMKGLDVIPDCLKCHHQQGYKIGDIRGGVSITIPMIKYNNDASIEKKYITLVHFFILCLSLICGAIIYKKLLNSIKKELSLNQEIKKSEEVLNQQSKMASLGEMLTNIAHQWRQPLSIISTSASGLKLQDDFEQLDKEAFHSSLNSILTSTKYLSQTIDDFSNFIKNDKQKVTFKISENIDKNLKILNASIRTHHITTVLDIEEDIELNSYPNELTQVFINLINNAKDALKEHDIKNRYIFITTYLEENKLTLKIKDNALGISDDIIDKVFEPYFTTKHQSQGTGLGLYMSHKIITESMKGSISTHNVEFEYDGENYTGSEFIITLPLDIGE